jgi:predicted GNAT superfamily acetyltransferase
MAKKPDLAAVLSDAGGGTRRKSTIEVKHAQHEERRRYRQPSREETAPITVHHPAQVRDQLKILAIEQRRTVQDMMAEALNDLFAKYGKPEIVPRNQQG